MNKKLSPIQNEMIEVLEDTVEYYSKDVSRRGIRTANLSFKEYCLFLTPDNKKCAVGRYLNKKDLERMKHEDLLDVNIGYFLDESGKSVLSTKIVKRLPLSFWKDLQKLHDTRNNWGREIGMTSIGKRKVESMTKKIKSGKYV